MASVAPSPVEHEIDDLLGQFAPRLSTPLSRRELLAEGAIAAIFVVACIVVALLVHSETDWSTPVAIVLVVAFAASRRVEFQAGAGFTAPSELVFVPMLFALPIETVPLLVAAGNVLGQAPDFVTGRRQPHKALLAVNDAWYALGPVAVLAATGAQHADWGDWPLYVLALGSQFAVDFGAASAREWFAVRTRPATLLRVLPWVWLVDALLAPIGLLAAFAGETWDYAFLLVTPLPLVLGVFATERQRRLAQAIELRAARADIDRRDLLRLEALEINDNVVQHLVVAHYLLERGEVEQARELVDQSLAEGKRIIGDLLEDVEPGAMRRREAAGRPRG